MIRRTFLGTAAAVMLSTAAFADGHSIDIVDTAVGAGTFTWGAIVSDRGGMASIRIRF